MKKYTGSVLLAATALLMSIQAHAWVATAVSADGSSFMKYDSPTPEDAQAEAVKGCSALHNGCRLTGRPARKAASVIANGEGGWGMATDPDPNKAAKLALAGCDEKAKHCRLTGAVWDGGATWASLAMSKSGMYLFTEAGTRTEAEATAIARCQKNSAPKDRCTVDPNFVYATHVFFALAKTPTKFGFGASSISLNAAKARAMVECNAFRKQGETCTLNETYENVGPTPAPAAMKQVLVEVERAKKTQAGPAVSRTKASQGIR
jgi:hypothetical protein